MARPHKCYRPMNPLMRGFARDLAIHFSHDLAASSSCRCKACVVGARLVVGVARARVALACVGLCGGCGPVLLVGQGRCSASCESQNYSALDHWHWNFSRVVHKLGSSLAFGVSHFVHGHVGRSGHRKHAHARHDARGVTVVCPSQVFGAAAQNPCVGGGLGDSFCSRAGRAMVCPKRCLACAQWPSAWL